jgi:hypothetical protein
VFNSIFALKNIKMKLSDNNRNALLLILQQSIEELADTKANDIFQGKTNQLIYFPPNGGFTESEEQAVKELEGNEHLKSALRKILAGNSADAFFDFFNNIDGTTDPDDDNWTGVMLVDIPESNEENRAFLHDELYASYWDWRKKRTNLNWKLDLLDD